MKHSQIKAAIQEVCNLRAANYSLNFSFDSARDRFFLTVTPRMAVLRFQVGGGAPVDPSYQMSSFGVNFATQGFQALVDGANSISELKWASDHILRSLGYIANVRNLKSLDDFKESDPNAIPAKEDIEFSWGRGDASAVIKHWKDLTNLKCVTESKAYSELRQLTDNSRAYQFKDMVEHLERNLRNVASMYWTPETDASGHANLILNMIKDITPTGCLISDAKDTRFYIDVKNSFIVKFN